MVVSVPPVVDAVPGTALPFPVGAVSLQRLWSPAPVLVVRVARAATGIRAPVLVEAARRTWKRPGPVPVVPTTTAAANAGLAGLPPLVGSEVAAKGARATTFVVGPSRVAAGIGVAVARLVAGGGLVDRGDGATVAGKGRGVAVAGAAVPGPVGLPLAQTVVTS